MPPHPLLYTTLPVLKKRKASEIEEPSPAPKSKSQRLYLQATPITPPEHQIVPWSSNPKKPSRPGPRPPPPRNGGRPAPFQGPASQGPSRLEQLPAEIRNRIYHFTLVSEDKALRVRYANHFDHRSAFPKEMVGFFTHRPAPFSHALTQVNRFIRSESLEMFYTLNTFQFRYLNDLHPWLEFVGRNCRFLRNIRLNTGITEVSQHARRWSLPRNIPSSVADLTRPFSYDVQDTDELQGEGLYASRDGEEIGGRTEMSFTVSDKAEPVFSTKDAVMPMLRGQATAELKRIATHLKEIGPHDLVIGAKLAHCYICATGRFWCCDKRKWSKDEAT